MSELNEKQKLLMSLLFTPEQFNKELDPIRIMKGLFILTMKIPDHFLKEKYSFVPYLYGPYCSEVYDDINLLSLKGYISINKNSGQSWLYYSLSKNGEDLAKTVLTSFDDKVAKFIFHIRSFIVSNSFNDLLKKVYAAFPDFATNSVFRG